MKNFSCILALILFTSTLFSQVPDKEYFLKNNEVYFEFRISGRSELNELTKIISIDNVKDNLVKAYANEEEWNNFLQYKYDYKILPHPGDVENIKMSDSPDDLRAWDSYPTYDNYISMMNLFAENYPTLCRIVNAGTTVNGRKIVFAVISDNVHVREAEPQFMYSSTMHGDETTGYVLMLRLIDSLLTSYGTDPRITNLVNNIEIWINPNANPDGTYYISNNSVTGARRYNANGVDINRNFPDPTGYNTGVKQPETLTMMSLSDSNRFVLSANFHGGAEVINYPWDVFARLHPDNNWFVQISRKYADTAQANSPAGYLNDFNNGITNGYAWYQVFGGRQDYMTYFKRGREVTMEISATKLLNASLLPAHWNYNRLSLLSYMENCLYGVRGIVSDSLGNPLKAKIRINGFDMDSSEVITDLRNGYYNRMLAPGTYNLTFSADSFVSKTINNVVVTQNSTTWLNVQLTSLYVPVELVSFSAHSSGDFIELKWKTASEANNNGFEIERKDQGSSDWEKIVFVRGNSTTSEPSFYSYIDKPNRNGNYSYRLKQIDFDGSFAYSGIVNADFGSITFQLMQNYPNPFNPSTTLKYSLGEDSFVKINVYDILGREVSLLENQYKFSGEYEIQFDGNSLSSGVYIVKLSAESRSGNIFNFIRKINLLR
jgi:hypothetical protein